MALFTNKDDLDINLISQVAQLDKDNKSELDEFRDRMFPVTAWYPHDKMVRREGDSRLLADARVTVRNARSAQDGHLEKAVGIIQPILESIAKRGGITDHDAMNLQMEIDHVEERKVNFALAINKIRDSEYTNAQLSGFFLHNAVFLPGDQITHFNTALIENPFEFLLNILEQAADLFRHQTWCTLTKCPQCDSIYLPNPTRVGQRFCSRRCLNRSAKVRWISKHTTDTSHSAAAG